MIFAGLCVLVFLAAVALDYADVRHKQAVQNVARWRAAFWSVLMYTIGALGFLSVVEVSYWLMIPECIGLLVGTLIALPPAE